jgi:hypothetical protein
MTFNIGKYIFLIFIKSINGLFYSRGETTKYKDVAEDGDIGELADGEPINVYRE